MIRRILVANRGEIARRVFRTCRDMTIETVAVYSDPDAAEPFVSEADHAVSLPGSTATETYLDIDAVIRAAKESAADAIHPGYGFLAESARFARRVLSESLIWIGPSPEAMEIMGSKLASKELMAASGVPILPGVPLSSLSDSESLDAAVGIGYPVLVKASAGGGGKGMRVVREPPELIEAIAGARREAEASFGDGTVFLEKYLDDPRHVEVQVFGDQEGNVVSLFERECSIQRRHQKIVEESPSPAVDSALRGAMSEAATAAARAVGYTGAGTVEFLVQGAEFFFLEMNTRLQVEHPVTEMVTGLDLVRLQIEVADGVPLRIRPALTGHAVETRLYAEDAANDFLPVTGVIHHIEFEDQPGLRVDSGVESGSTVTPFYDPMLAKVVFHAPTREAAAQGLARALRRARIHGSINNRALLVRILEHPEFLAGDFDTHFLERHDPALLGRPLVDETGERLAAVAAALSDQVVERSRAKVLSSIPSGWRNNRSHQQLRSYRGEHGTHTVEYTIDPAVTVSGWPDLEVTACSARTVELTSGAAAHRYEVARYGLDRFLDSDEGPVRLQALPRFASTESVEVPGSLHAPMPGKVIRVDVSVGDLVSEGQVLVVLEAMKMEHSLRAPYHGLVTEVATAPGDQVDAGAILAVVTASST